MTVMLKRRQKIGILSISAMRDNFPFGRAVNPAKRGDTEKQKHQR